MSGLLGRSQPNWWRTVLVGGLGVLAAGVIGGCAAEGNAGRPVDCSTASTPCLNGSATVAMQTSKGEVRFQLDGAAAPLTAGNFVDLVQRGVYNGTVFHRVVREPTPSRSGIAGIWPALKITQSGSPNVSSSSVVGRMSMLRMNRA